MNNLGFYLQSDFRKSCGLLIAELSRYGFHPQPVVVGVILTAIVGYIVGHVVVWIAPAK
jgi:hypothetical protein